jgi:hypothetical protein
MFKVFLRAVLPLWLLALIQFFLFLWWLIFNPKDPPK